MQGLTIQQVQGVTGHKSIRTSEIYTHIDPMQMDAVVKAQKAISGKKKSGTPKETVNGKKNSKGLKIIKMPVRKTV
jgi:hypothetical protein